MEWLYTSKTNLNTFLVAVVAATLRIFVWYTIPLDWNWDSYHHWQISYLSLKIGFSKGRFWDLNGCEYYWGIIPHFCQAILMMFFGSSIFSLRIMNLFLGSLNAVLVHMILSRNSSKSFALYGGLVFAVFPVASIFDILAMQDTIALTFILSSLYFYQSHLFWSGLLLALSGQCRTEFLLIGVLIILLYILLGKLSTEKIPYLIGWFSTTFLFSYFLFDQTGNPFYPLYWSLYNVFGGWETGNEGKSVIYLMVKWIGWKLRVWPTKPTGILLILIGISFISIIIYLWKNNIEKYIYILYFFPTLVVLSPTFVTYIGSNTKNLMIMLRMSIPIFTLSIITTTIILRLESFSPVFKKLKKLHLHKFFIFLMIASYIYFIPYYSDFQSNTINAFQSADQVISYYKEGTFVCDYPMVNYRLVNKWGFSPYNLLGNHYSPHYYAISDPMDFAHWFEENNITLWSYHDQRALPVLRVVTENYPLLLVSLPDTPSLRLYEVNQTELGNILARGR